MAEGLSADLQAMLNIILANIQSVRDDNKQLHDESNKNNKALQDNLKSVHEDSKTLNKNLKSVRDEAKNQNKKTSRPFTNKLNKIKP